MRSAIVPDPSWSFDNIPYDRIDRAAIRADTNLFFVLVAASFIEISSDIYTGNLVRHYAANAEVADWLTRGWEPEELRHGRVLKAYVTAVWPEFDWEATYRAFIGEYACSCTEEELEPSHALEMAARCIVEMGTSTYYQAIHDYTTEPVLKQIASLIRNDEIGHFKHFYKYFQHYNVQEENSRLRIFGALWRRVLEIRNGDAECALWHIFKVENPEESRNSAAFRARFADVATIIRRHYPFTMAIKMTLRPLDLPAPLQQLIVRPLAGAARQWLVH